MTKSYYKEFTVIEDLCNEDVDYEGQNIIIGSHKDWCDAIFKGSGTNMALDLKTDKELVE